MATQSYSAEVLINTAKATRNIDDARQSSDQLNKSLTGLFATIKGGQADLNSMAKSLGSISTSVAEAQKASKDFANTKIAESKAIAQANKAMDSKSASAAAGATRDLAKGIDETASASARLQQASPAKTLNESATAANKFGDSLANQRYLLYDIGATYRTLAIAAQAIPAASLAAATSYERDFSQVMRVTGQTQGMSEGLRAELKQLGSEIPLSFAELSNIAQIGGQMNVPSEQLGKFTETVAKFVATADGATIDSTTQAFGRMANLFNEGDNFDPEFFNRLGSAISMTADNAVTSEAKIISMLEKLAPVAKQAGLSAQEVTAFSSALSSVGLAPEISSGFFTRFFGTLNKDVAAGSDRLDVYAKTLGITTEEFKDMYKNDPSGVLQGIAEAMSSMDKVSTTALLGELGIKATRDQRVLAGLSESYGVLEQAMTDVDQAYAKASYLDATSAGVFGTFASNLKELGTALMNLGDSVGSGPLAMINTLTEALTGFIQSASALIDKSPGLAKAINTLLLIGSAVGGVFALKSAMAFMTAAMVGFQQASGSGISSAFKLSGSMTSVAKTMLASKGATVASTNALLANASGMQAVRIAATTTAGSIETMNAASARGATSLMNMNVQNKKTFGNMASSLLGFAGGPLGVAIAAVGTLGTAWFTQAQSVKNSAEEVVRAFAMTDQAGVEAVASAFARDKSSWANTTSDLRTVGKTYQELADIAGVSMGDVTRALAGGKDATDEFIRGLEAQRDAARETYGDFGEGSNIAPALNDIIVKLQSYSNEMQTMDDIASATKEGQDALGTSAEGAGDAFSDASVDVQDYGQSLDDAISKAFGFIDAQGALNTAMERLGSSLGKTGSVDPNAGGADTLSALQATLQAQAQVLQQSIDAKELSAQAASESYAAFVQDLMAQLVAMGVDTDPIKESMNNALSAVQSTFDGQAVEVPMVANTEPVVQDVDSVMVWMSEYLSDPMYITMAAGGVDETAQNVNALVAYIAEQTGLPFTAVIQAFTNPAGDNTEQVAKYMKEVVGTDYTAFINADTSAAAANVQSFATYTAAQIQELQAGLLALAAMGGPAGVVLNTASVAVGILNTPAQTVVKANQAAAPSFAPLVKGYDDVARSAGGAGKAAKGLGRANKANNDAEKQANAAKRAAAANRKAEAAEARKAAAAKKKADAEAAKAAKAEAKAAKDAQKAAQQLKKDWDAAEQQIAGFAGRVGNAFQYVFDDTQGVDVAKDNYYEVLNGIKSRLADQKQQLKDLRAENKALNSERKVQLNDAEKLEKMAKYADASGDGERAKYYRDEAKALKDSATETKNKIDANTKEADAISKGIGNLKGYSDAAIANRKEIRNLESASLAVAEAYAASGSSATTVKNKTVEWTKKAKDHSLQLGYNKTDIEKVTTATKTYTDKLGKVPKTIETKIKETKTTTFKATDSTKSGVNSAKKTLKGVPGSKTSSLKGKNNMGSGVKSANRTLKGVPGSKTSTLKGSNKMGAGVNSAKKSLKSVPSSKTTNFYLNISSKERSDLRKLAALYSVTGNFAVSAAFNAVASMWTGGLVPGFASGGRIPNFSGKNAMPAFASGGLIPGTPPANPKKDNIMASIDGKGMAHIRSGEYIQSQPAVEYYGQDFMDKLNRMEIPRYYTGGAVGGNNNSGGLTSSGVLDLSAETIQSLARLVQKDIYLYADTQMLAQSVKRGNDVFAQRGGKF